MGQVLCLWTCTQSVILALGELQSSPSFFRFGASAGLGRKSWSHLGSAAQGLRAEAGGVRGAFWDLKPGGLVGVIRFCTKLGPTHPAGKRGTSLPVWPEEKGLPGGITWDLGHQLSLLPREGRDSSRVDPRLPFTPPPRATSHSLVSGTLFSTVSRTSRALWGPHAVPPTGKPACPLSL